MKISMKAAIYSALVFPGAGYFIVNHKIRGYVFLGLTLACLWPITREAIYKAQAIADKIIQGALPYDIQVIQEQIRTMPGVLPEGFLAGISIAIGVIWLFGIVDAYRLGMALETEKRTRKL